MTWERLWGRREQGLGSVERDMWRGEARLREEDTVGTRPREGLGPEDQGAGGQGLNGRQRAATLAPVTGNYFELRKEGEEHSSQAWKGSWRAVLRSPESPGNRILSGQRPSGTWNLCYHSSERQTLTLELSPTGSSANSNILVAIFSSSKTTKVLKIERTTLKKVYSAPAIVGF